MAASGSAFPANSIISGLDTVVQASMRLGLFNNHELVKRRRALKTLFQHIAKGEEQQAAMIVAERNDLIVDKGILSVEEWNDLESWTNPLSPLEYAAMIGESEIMGLFLRYLPDKSKVEALKQLKNVKEQGMHPEQCTQDLIIQIWWLEEADLEKQIEVIWTSGVENVSDRKAFIYVLAEKLENEIKVNDIQYCPQEKKTLFDVVPERRISIKDYLEFINGEFQIPENGLFVSMMIYLDRYLQSNEIKLSKFNVHRLLITSFVLAHKMLLDGFVNLNEYAAEIGGVSNPLLNRLEEIFFRGLGFNAFISADANNAFEKQIEPLITSRLTELQNQFNVSASAPESQFVAQNRK